MSRIGSIGIYDWDEGRFLFCLANSRFSAFDSAVDFTLIISR